MVTDAPCKGCKDRELYCHSTCEKYKEFDLFRQRERERASLARADERYFFGSMERNKYGHKIRKGQDLHKEKRL